MKSNWIGRSGVCLVAAAATLVASETGVADAQQGSQRCSWLCEPSVTLMPGMLRTHLFGGPTVETMSSGAEHRLSSTSSLEVILTVAAKTRVPRLSAFGSLQWLPNATEARNPFTLYNASELGSPVRANAPTATFGLSGMLLPAESTHGWFDASVTVGDLFSQAARPDDKSAYTHKLDVDLVTHLNLFGALPKGTYAHRIALYGILDYVATGLPRAGDEVPIGRVFVTRARPTALIIGLALPLSPKAP
jgi:hypothetical protein